MRQSVKKGEPLSIPAEEYNAFLQVANDYRTKSVAARPLQQERFVPHGLVRIKNTTGVDLTRFSVLGIDGPLFSPDDNLEEYQNRLAFVGVTPTTDHLEKFAIIQEPLAADAIGLAMVTGVTVAQVNVTSEGHGYANLVDGESGYLESAAGGAVVILSKGSGTETVWAHVLLGSSPCPSEQAVLDADLTATGTATASIWRFDGTALADTGEDVEVHPWMMKSDTTVGSGSQVWIRWKGRWYIENAECP